MDLPTEGQRPPSGHDSLAFGVPRPTTGATELNDDLPRSTTLVPPSPRPPGEA
jgi:hypothetical protein